MSGCHTPFQKMQPTVEQLTEKLSYQESRITHLQNFVQIVSDRLNDLIYRRQSSVEIATQNMNDGKIAPFPTPDIKVLVEENIRLVELVRTQELEIASLRHRIGLLGETLHHMSTSKE